MRLQSMPTETCWVPYLVVTSLVTHIIGSSPPDSLLNLLELAALFGTAPAQSVVGSRVGAVIGWGGADELDDIFL